MRRFILKTGSFFLFSLFFFSISTITLDYLLKNSTQNYYYSWNILQQKDKINAELIYLGSSRASLHYNPRISDTLLHLSTFNVGMECLDMKGIEMRYKLYRKYNKKPRRIVINVDNHLLYKRTNLISESQFLPFIDDTLIRNYIEYRGFNKVKSRFKIFKYFTSFMSLENLKYLNAPGEKYKGFLWSNQSDSLFKVASDDTILNFCPEDKLVFEELVKTMRNENIDVFLVYSPQYIKYTNNIHQHIQLTNFYQEIANKYGCRFYNYTLDEICYDKSNFFDPIHLNGEAASIFTAKLCSRIKKDLAHKPI